MHLYPLEHFLCSKMHRSVRYHGDDYLIHYNRLPASAVIVLDKSCIKPFLNPNFCRKSHIYLRSIEPIRRTTILLINSMSDAGLSVVPACPHSAALGVLHSDVTPNRPLSRQCRPASAASLFYANSMIGMP